MNSIKFKFVLLNSGRIEPALLLSVRIYFALLKQSGIDPTLSNSLTVEPGLLSSAAIEPVLLITVRIEPPQLNSRSVLHYWSQPGSILHTELSQNQPWITKLCQDRPLRPLNSARIEPPPLGSTRSNPEPLNWAWIDPAPLSAVGIEPELLNAVKAIFHYWSQPGSILDYRAHPQSNLNFWAQLESNQYLWVQSGLNWTDVSQYRTCATKLTICFALLKSTRIDPTWLSSARIESALWNQIALKLPVGPPRIEPATLNTGWICTFFLNWPLTKELYSSFTLMLSQLMYKIGSFQITTWSSSNRLRNPFTSDWFSEIGRF